MNIIPLPEVAGKKEGGSSSKNKERCHALVIGCLGYSSFITYSGASRHMDSMQDSFSSLHPYNGPSIIMGDDSEIPSKGIGRIDLDNGYFNNVLYVPDLVANLLYVYQMTHTGLSKRVTFTQEDVEISEISTGQIVAVGIADHESRMYKFSHFII